MDFIKEYISFYLKGAIVFFGLAVFIMFMRHFIAWELPNLDRLLNPTPDELEFLRFIFGMSLVLCPIFGYLITVN